MLKTRKIRYALLSLFLSFIIALVLFPLSVKADAKVVNASSITASSWTAPSGESVLNMDVDKTLSYISVPSDASVRIEGSKTLNINKTGSTNNYAGIASKGNLVFGSGTTTNITVEYKASSSYVYGIRSTGTGKETIIEEGATVNIQVGIESTSYSSIFWGAATDATDHKTIIDGNLNILSTGFGIQGDEIIVNSSGKLRASLSAPTSKNYIGMKTNSLTINGGEVYINQTDNTVGGEGTRIDDALTINDGYFYSASSSGSNALRYKTISLSPAVAITKPINNGTTIVSNYIYVTDADTNEKATEVVIENVSPSSITILDPLNSTDFHYFFTETVYPLNISATPDTASKDVNWSVSDSSVAVINENGEIQGLKEGNVIVTAVSKHDSSITFKRYIKFIKKWDFDFSQSKYSYNGSDNIFYGYLDFDTYEFNNVGSLSLKNFNYEGTEQRVMYLTKANYMDFVSIHVYGNNTISSSYKSDDGNPGTIIYMTANNRTEIRIHEDGASLTVLDHGYNNAIHASSSYFYINSTTSSGGSGYTGNLNITSNATGIISNNIVTTMGDGTCAEITAVTGIKGNLTVGRKDDHFIIHANDYGIEGGVSIKNAGTVDISAYAENSSQHGIGSRSFDFRASDITYNPYLKIYGSNQAVEYLPYNYINYPEDRLDLNYAAITTPSDYTVGETTVIDNNTGNPAKTIIVEGKVLTVSNGTGTGDYGTGDTVTVSAADILGYQFAYWDVRNTEGWDIDGYYTDYYAKLFSNAEDVCAQIVMVTVPEGRTHMRPHYSAVVYKISYNLNGGSFAGSYPTQYTVNSEVTLTNPKRKGYVFAGWYDPDGNYPTSRTITIEKGTTGDKTFIADWEPLTFELNCADTHFFTEKEYQFTYNIGPAQYIDDTSVVWSSSNTSVATVSPDGVVTAKAPGTATITAYNQETDASASKEITITDLYDFVTDDTERGDLETDGFAWRKNNFSVILTIKNLNLTRNNEYVIKLPTESFIEFEGNNTLTSTYISADGTPGNIITTGKSEEEITNIQIRPKAMGINQPASVLTLQDEGYNNGISAVSLYIEPSESYDSSVSRYYYAAGKMTINANAAGYYGRGMGDFYTGHDLDLTINANDGLAGCTYAQVWYSGKLTVNAENYGIIATGNLYLRDTSHAYISAIAKDPDDAGIAVKTRNIKDNNGSASLTGDDMCFFEGSAAALEIIPEEHPSYGLETICHPADYSIRDQFVFDNALNETAKLVVLGGTRYSVTYQLDGGSVDGYNPVKYSKYSNDFELINPTKPGYIFTGWLDGESEEKLMQATVYHTDQADRVFTATWAAETYQISYNLNGGSAEGNPETYTIEDEQIVLNNPSRDYYEFAGWSEAGSEDITMIGVIPAGSYGDKVFTAHWTPVDYTITYDYDGGDAEGNPAVYNVETESFTLNHPVKNGYDFEGWMIDDVQYPEYTVETGSHGDLEIKAVWTPTVYTITYELDGGEFTKPNPSTYTIESEEFVITDPQKNGYEFAGWILNGKNVGKSYTVASGTTGNLVLTASWTYIIVLPEDFWLNTYELNLIKGQTGVIEYEFYPENTTDQSVIWSTSDEAVATVDANGTVTAAGAGTAYITGTSAADETLLDTCSVTVTELTVSFSTGTDTVIAPQHPFYGTPIERPEDPSREGYEFAGWMVEGEIYDFSRPVYSDITITADWTPIEYLISIDTDGGSGTYPTVYTIESETIVLEDPVKEGYLFLGWTGSNGDVPEKNVTIQTGSTGSRTYVANWERLPDSITLSVGSVTLELGGTETAQLTATVLPSAAVNKTVVWESSDPDIAEIDQTGKVIAVSEGTAVITAKTVNGLTDTCIVTVERKTVPVTQIRLDKTTLELEIGGTYTFTATIRPATATDKTLTWTSDNEDVATITQDGTVTAVGTGTAVITASSVNGVTASCTVTVKKPGAVSVAVTPSTLTLKKGETSQLSAAVEPAEADQTVTWSSSEDEIAAVDTTGKVTAAGYGTATITATASNGKTATCQVTVESNYTIENLSLNLESPVGVKCKVYVPDEELSKISGLVWFDGKWSDPVLLSKLKKSTVNGKVTRVFTTDVATPQLRDTIKVKLQDEAGTALPLTYNGVTTTEGQEYTAYAHIKEVMDNSTNADLVRLAKTLDDLGKYSQYLFDYNTGNIEGDLDPVEEIPAGALDQYTMAMTGSADGIEYSEIKLEFASDTVLRVYFELTGDNSYKDYTFTVDGEEVTPQKSGSRYVIKKSQIASALLDEEHVFKVCKKGSEDGIEIKCSALSYVQKMLAPENDQPDTDLRNVLISLYWYNDAANTAFGQ